MSLMPESRRSVIIEAEISNKRGNSFEIVVLLIFMGGQTMAAMPTNKREFRMLLPITVAIKTSVFPEMREANETANSGALVPNATIVKPINCLGSLKFEAAEDAPSTNQSAPLIRITNPTIRSMICNIISMFIF